ncbi:MerR family transcriptional regulator [uncultured Phascolarctobacterium sp.]|uniref:MerR family transcriptional regulator n=1 Tax=uncultured Phascolarctobacterium sp. TaxID=512296 RepID=UPI002609C49F|nr:MerR family transcriptional regulator [uncultured Phascolarctobacterium sp.]
MFYTIGEMAKIVNVPPSTLRYYDKEGLLPFVERTDGGIRMFKESDYEGLCIINCLKNSGMPLKDIKNFMQMVSQGDASIESRLELIEKQRERVLQDLEKIQQLLKILDYKVWYYSTAKAAGTTAIPREMPEENIPKELLEIRRYLKDMHYRNSVKK